MIHFQRGEVVIMRYEFLILKALQSREMYAAEIVKMIETESGGEISIRAPHSILYRLKSKGYLTSRTMITDENRTRVYYKLTAAGETQLRELRDNLKTES